MIDTCSLGDATLIGRPYGTDVGPVHGSIIREVLHNCLVDWSLQLLLQSNSYGDAELCHIHHPIDATKAERHLVVTELECGVKLINELLVGRLGDNEDPAIWRSVEQVPDVLLDSQGLDCYPDKNMSIQNATRNEPLLFEASSS